MHKGRSILTANQHDADGEDLFRVGVRGDVPEAHAGQAAEGEVKRCDILVLDGGTRVGIAVVVPLPDGHAQVVQPTDLVLQVGLLHVADGVPDARQPVGDEGEDAHEQHEDRSAVLGVAVQLPGDTHQPQQPGRLQQADQSGGLQNTATRVHCSHWGTISSAAYVTTGLQRGRKFSLKLMGIFWGEIFQVVNPPITAHIWK